MMSIYLLLNQTIIVSSYFLSFKSASDLITLSQLHEDKISVMTFVKVALCIEDKISVMTFVKVALCIEDKKSVIVVAAESREGLRGSLCTLFKK